MVESGTAASRNSCVGEGLQRCLPGGLQVRRSSIKAWGCTSIDSCYIKRYKVGQGSYGFEFALYNKT